MANSEAVIAYLLTSVRVVMPASRCLSNFVLSSFFHVFLHLVPPNLAILFFFVSHTSTSRLSSRIIMTTTVSDILFLL